VARPPANPTSCSPASPPGSDTPITPPRNHSGEKLRIHTGANTEVPDSVQIDLPDADKRDAVRISDGNCGTTRSDAPTASTSAELGVGRDEAPQPDLLALDADAIASRILEAVTPEQADRIAKAIDRRLLTWRIGTFDAGLPLGTGGGGRRW
jgi:hypothetical protein